MNAYAFDALNPGLTVRFEVTVTEEMMTMFRALSGDINPLHCDAQFAESRGFPGRVVYGMLTSSFYSTLAGVYLPGRDCLLHSIEVKMLRPVFIGDKLTVTGEVAEKHDELRMVRIRASITNGQGEKVSRAVLQAGVLRDGGEESG